MRVLLLSISCFVVCGVFLSSEYRDGKRRQFMTHDVRMWIVPLVAAICGLLLFATSKDKWATIGGYIFLAGFVILVWLGAVGR